MTRPPLQRLDDIEAAIARVREAMVALAAAASAEQEDLAHDAIMYRLLVIGEAAKALPDHVRAAAPQVPWRNIARLRDLLAHQYHRVDLQVIRATCEAPLEQLAAALPSLRDAAKEDG